MTTATVMARMVGLATIAIPRTATATAIPRTATAIAIVIPRTPTATVTATGTTATATVPGNGQFPGFPSTRRDFHRAGSLYATADRHLSSCSQASPQISVGCRSAWTPPKRKEVYPIFRPSCVCHLVLVGRATRFDILDRQPNLNPTSTQPRRDEHERLQENPRRDRRLRHARRNRPRLHPGLRQWLRLWLRLVWRVRRVLLPKLFLVRVWFLVQPSPLRLLVRLR